MACSGRLRSARAPLAGEMRALGSSDACPGVNWLTSSTSCDGLSLRFETNLVIRPPQFLAPALRLRRKFVLLPAAYLSGALPAFAIGQLDEFLSRWRTVML